MSFAFGFDGDDIEPDEQGVAMAEVAGSAITNVPALTSPKLHSFDAMLSSIPASLSYTCHGGLPPRRALYDMRAQQMSEADPDASVDPSLSADDIRPGEYEGGFKTWECATDLAAFAPGYCANLAGLCPSLHVIELGAGTAVPSCALLAGHLSRSAAALALTMADYNLPVLRLASVPNVFLAAASALDLLAPGPPSAEDDIETSPGLLRAVRDGLTKKNVTVRCIEGAWSEEFVDQAVSNEQSQKMATVVLASETIYAPGSLPPFTTTLLEILRRESSNGPVAALVAAKRVYFGVGGGVAEFVAEVQRQGGSATEIWQTTGSGVGRCILEVQAG